VEPSAWRSRKRKPLLDSGAVDLDGDGTIVGTFTVDDTADLGVLEVSLYRADTDAMRVGSYTYWIDGADTDTGKRQTYAQGTLEVRRK
jgi:hypothetical protein